MKIVLIYLSLFLIVLVSGCRPNNSSAINSVSPTDVNEEEGTVIITDITRREWGITHAVSEYYMKSKWFHFGIGIGAIPSVDNPRVLDQTSPDFPAPDYAIEIFGTNIDEEHRAYAKYELARHEVFNDDYQGTYYNKVAVCYCPLFNLAAVYDRYLEGRPLTFAPSGWTYGEHTGSSLFVLIDKESFSLWFPMEINRKRGLYCIAGKHADKYAPEVQELHRGTWHDWLITNPDTKFVTE